MNKTIGWMIAISLFSLPLHADIQSNQPNVGSVYSNDGLNRYRQQIEQEQQKRKERLKNYEQSLDNPYRPKNIQTLNQEMNQ